MIKLCLAIILFLACCEGQRSINFSSCSDNPITELVVDPCDSDPCAFKRGGTITMAVKAASNQDSDKLKLTVKAKLVGQDVKFPGLKEDACKDYGIACPIQKGDPINFKMDIKVLPFYPTLDTNVTLQIQGSAGPLFCFTAPVKIV